LRIKEQETRLTLQEHDDDDDEYRNLLLSYTDLKSGYMRSQMGHILLMMGATGTILKSLRQYMSNTQGKHEMKELQKIATLGTADILQEVII